MYPSADQKKKEFNKDHLSNFLYCSEAVQKEHKGWYLPPFQSSTNSQMQRILYEKKEVLVSEQNDQMILFAIF